MFRKYSIAVILFVSIALAQHPSFDSRYHTVSEVIDEITALADTYSAYCALESLGHSGVDSIIIWGLKISENPLLDEDETSISLVGGQHADEPAGVEVCMWMARDLLQRIHAGDSLATEWWRALEIWIIPQMNPDGRIMCLDSGYAEWRKTKRDNNLDGICELYIDGVDPNRNWDYLWDIYESEDADNTKGPYPFSEQCVITMRDFYMRERPLFAVDYHSPDSTGGNKMWFSWWFNEGPYYGYSPDMSNCWLDIRNSFADATLDEEGNSYARAASYHDKPKLQTWTYYSLGICSIVLEITNQCFWTGEIIDTISARVGRGTYSLFDRAMSQMLVTHVVDSSTSAPITHAEVEVVQLQHAYFPPRTVDPIHGTNRRWLRSGYYTIQVKARDYFTTTIDSVFVSTGAPTHLRVAMNRDTYISESALPKAPVLFASPNPFNSSVLLHYTGVAGPNRAGVQIGIEIFDLNGKHIADLPSPSANAEGATPVLWSPAECLSSGIYLARVRFEGGSTAFLRLVYIK